MILFEHVSREFADLAAHTISLITGYKCVVTPWNDGSNDYRVEIVNDRPLSSAEESRLFVIGMAYHGGFANAYKIRVAQEAKG